MTASPGELTPKKHYPASSSRRLSGRPALPGANSSRNSLISQSSLEGLASALNATPPPGTEGSDKSSRRHRMDRLSEKLVRQVAEWLDHEKTKRANRKSKFKVSSRRKSKSPPTAPDAAGSGKGTPSASRSRAASVNSDSSEVSLDRLQRIVDDTVAALGLDKSPRLGRKHSKRSMSHRSLTKVASSDTEYYDNNDILVPSCDGFLDNSKSLSYSGGKPSDGADDAASISGRKEDKERQAWLTFKNEIIRLAHTLRLRGWRRVPLESGDRISVERLSGALTNAVYVVTPPKDLPVEEGKKSPTKVLLRIYGPQVDIDREKELSMLRRLARKKIGPRLLGTFLNGRFEQFFNATTLTYANLREPETSKQIAKRMRELHDGIDLLDEERLGGPAVWKNWDRWVDQAERRLTTLDNYIRQGRRGSIRKPGDAWKARGLVCGVEWAFFKATVERYRKYLEDYYGGQSEIREKLVFAHNDTQYGNILRLRPDDEKSPLLQPANEHKQLIVIDFEYAGANTPGLEFANHFTEWAYNYHDPATPYACNTAAYPTPEQQHRFIRAYVDHHTRRSSFTSPSTTNPSTSASSSTPALHHTPSTSSIAEFMLDARVPPGGWNETESRREKEVEDRVQTLMKETRLWRVANSAHWIAWGIVQAKIPGYAPEEEAEVDEEGVEEGDEFDYLGYAQERALFFWGDCVLLGIVTEEELPEELRGKLKYVRY